jgi:hypothetical protein
LCGTAETELDAVKARVTGAACIVEIIVRALEMTMCKMRSEVLSLKDRFWGALR